MRVPVVSYDCMTGPKEMISDGITGFLVEQGNYSSLGKAMICVRDLLNADMSGVQEACRLGVAHVSTDRILSQWNQLLSSLDSEV